MESNAIFVDSDETVVLNLYKVPYLLPVGSFVYGGKDIRFIVTHAPYFGVSGKRTLTATYRVRIVA